MPLIIYAQEWTKWKTILNGFHVLGHINWFFYVNINFPFYILAHWRGCKNWTLCHIHLCTYVLHPYVCVPKTEKLKVYTYLQAKGFSIPIWKDILYKKTCRLLCYGEKRDIKRKTLTEKWCRHEYSNYKKKFLIQMVLLTLNLCDNIICF